VEKDRSITDLLERLRSSVGFNQLEMVDFWEGDRCAIGFRKENRIVYVSTYNYVDEKTARYDYDLELTGTAGPDDFKVVKEVRGATETILIAELREYLGIE
jgi:hypothetical protein